MSKIELVKEALKEWQEGKLSESQALYNIMICVSDEPPTEKCIKWAEGVTNNEEKYRTPIRTN